MGVSLRIVRLFASRSSCWRFYGASSTVKHPEAAYPQRWWNPEASQWRIWSGGTGRSFRRFAGTRTWSRAVGHPQRL